MSRTPAIFRRRWFSTLRLVFSCSPESPPRFMLWRWSVVVNLFGCKRRLHLLKLCGHHVESVLDLLCCHYSASFESPAHVQRGPVGDVVVGDHSFVFELLSTSSHSLLFGKGAFLDLHLALDVVNCVRRFHIHNDLCASNRFHEYRERRSSLRYDGRGRCAEIMMGDSSRYWTNLDLEPTQARWNETCRNTLCSRCLVNVR